MREHLKAIVWPRNEADNDGPYRYVIVGMLVTDEPLQGLDGNEFLVEGPGVGLAEILQQIPKRQPSRRVGDAVDVLTGLCDL